MMLLHWLTISVIFTAITVITTNENSLYAGQRIITAKNGQKYLVSYVHFQQMRNKMLLVKPISTVVKPNHKECRQACLKTPGCVSMNAKELNATYFCCQLLDKDHFQKKNYFIDYTGSDYFVVTVSVDLNSLH